MPQDCPLTVMVSDSMDHRQIADWSGRVIQIAVADKVMLWEAPWPFEIKGVIARRGSAGSSGQTVFDVKLDGASLWTLPADRPKFLSTDPDGARKTWTPDTTAGAMNALLQVDVVEIESGGPEDLAVFLRVARTG